MLTDSSGEFEVAVSNDILWIKSRMPGVVQDGSSLVSTGLVSCLQDDHAIDLLCLRMTSREEAQAADPSCPFRSVFVADTDNAGGLARRIACRLSYTLRSELTSTPRSVFYESGRRARAMLERILSSRRYRRIIAEYYTVAPLLDERLAADPQAALDSLFALAKADDGTTPRCAVAPAALPGRLETATAELSAGRRSLRLTVALPTGRSLEVEVNEQVACTAETITAPLAAEAVEGLAPAAALNAFLTEGKAQGWLLPAPPLEAPRR